MMHLEKLNININILPHFQYPFNASATRTEPFYDESGAVITQVPMMVQEGNFAYVTNMQGLDGYVLELPYGTQDRLSMIIVLPKRGFKLNDIAANLKELGLGPILERIAKFRREAPEDNEVEVLMPKFVTTTDFKLQQTLRDVGEIHGLLFHLLNARSYFFRWVFGISLTKDNQISAEWPMGYLQSSVCMQPR